MMNQNLEDLAVYGVVPTLEVGEPVFTNGYWHDVYILRYDHGKQGVTTIIQKLPRDVPEEITKANRERAEHIVWQMSQSQLQPAG